MTLNEVRERAERIYKQPAGIMRFRRQVQQDDSKFPGMYGVQPDWSFSIGQQDVHHHMDSNGHLLCRDQHPTCAALEDIFDAGVDITPTKS